MEEKNEFPFTSWGNASLIPRICWTSITIAHQPTTAAYSASLKLSLVSHSFFWMMKTTSSPSSWLASPVATASQCRAPRYFFTKSMTGCLSRKMANPVGLRMRSISSSRSSPLQPFFSMSESTFHAWSKS